MSVGLTRRGWTVLAAAAVAVALGVVAGARALDAIAVPALVALAAGSYQVAAGDPPRVTRSAVAPGSPGDVRTVETTVETDLPVELREESTAGLGPAARTHVLPAGGTVEYDVELLVRGDQELGPAVVTVTDSLGLVRRTVRSSVRTPVLVYPRVHALSDAGALSGLIRRAHTLDRRSFDSLREYVTGDSLRDVNWKASAKRPDDDLVVTEFADEAADGAVTVAAESVAGRGDEMASAAASVAVHLLDAGVRVALVAPGGDLPAGSGPDHRRAVMELLARTPAGPVTAERARDADVRVRAEPGSVTVTTDERTDRFADVVAADGRSDRLSDIVAGPDERRPTPEGGVT